MTTWYISHSLRLAALGPFLRSSLTNEAGKFLPIGDRFFSSGDIGRVGCPRRQLEKYAEQIAQSRRARERK
jgi:hypothetical protein